jgi:hypothetical protein
VMLNQYEIKSEQFNHSKIHLSACSFYSSRVQIAKILATLNHQKLFFFAYDFQLSLIDFLYVRFLNFEHVIKN